MAAMSSLREEPKAGAVDAELPAAQEWRDKKRYLWLTGLVAPTAMFVVLPMIWAMNQWGWHTVSQVLLWIGPLLLFAVALTVGVLGSVGINTAHELGHTKDSLKRWLSKITLAQTYYPHFFFGHNRGHHVRVATPEDPASVRMGESIWAFLPRSIWGRLRSSSTWWRSGCADST